ncbi:bcl-2-related ovarian killer protein isoform X2 [Nilaparvata lugens]|uniref:bcl-2-related ovarian killer protein isoform X2 n=1 Tax=Nilaparvata lugens TaxID=108931 RepID=UPI00193D2DAE|nr:bcl-2-related ovarian killer protein isoform X2 [Nilaparvata lugens]
MSQRRLLQKKRAAAAAAGAVGAAVGDLPPPGGGRRCSLSTMALTSENNNNDSKKDTSSNSLQLPGVAPHHRRKFSFPAALQSNLLGGLDATLPARRRLSNVSDAVTRKFSNTIGWRSAIPVDHIVQQGRTLCGQYVRCRLKRSGLFSRKCGLQRLRSAASLPGGYVVREVFPEMLGVGVELERMHPKLYAGVARQAWSSGGCGGVLASDKAASQLLLAIARELLRTEPTWAKVVSLYAVAGGLAVDCVRQGHPEYLGSIVESMGDVLEEDLAVWIADNGGWPGLLNYCRPPANDYSFGATVMLVTAVVFSTLLLILFLRWFGKFTPL